MDQLRSLLGKKVTGASLVETLVASILIMVVFGISMVTVGNVLERTVKSNTRGIDNELNRLEYLYRNQKIQVPDILDKDQWQIEITKKQENDLKYIVFIARNKQSQKEKTRTILE